MEKLKCKVCTQFVDRIKGRKHISRRMFGGADSQRLSYIRDHTQNNEHQHAMSLLQQSQGNSSGVHQHQK